MRRVCGVTPAGTVMVKPSLGVRTKTPARVLATLAVGVPLDQKNEVSELGNRPRPPSTVIVIGLVLPGLRLTSSGASSPQCTQSSAPSSARLTNSGVGEREAVSLPATRGKSLGGAARSETGVGPLLGEPRSTSARSTSAGLVVGSLPGRFGSLELPGGSGCARQFSRKHHAGRAARTTKPPTQ